MCLFADDGRVSEETTEGVRRVGIVGTVLSRSLLIELDV